MVHRDMNFVIRMFNEEVRDNERDNRLIEGIGKRREGGEEAPKTTFNRFEVNTRERIFKFTRNIRSNDRFGGNHSSNNKRDIFKMRFRKRKNIRKKLSKTP